MKWNKKNGKLSESLLRDVLNTYGKIEVVIVKDDKVPISLAHANCYTWLGMQAVINFERSSSARAAFFSYGDSMEAALGMKAFGQG